MGIKSRIFGLIIIVSLPILAVFLLGTFSNSVLLPFFFILLCFYSAVGIIFLGGLDNVFYLYLHARRARTIAREFAAKCMVKSFLELDDLRSWDSDPVFRRVLDPLNVKQYSKARDEAAELVQKFPDFAYLYRWWAQAFLNEDNYSEAKRVLLDGLLKSKKKYPLLNLMGEVEWKSGNLSDAVYWWIQGLFCQETVKGFGEEVDAYLYLYYVANALKFTTLAKQLSERVDFIRPGKIRLAPDAINSLTSRLFLELTLPYNTSPIIEALRMLEKKYFTPELQPNSKQYNEISKLINVAQYEHAPYTAREEAIKRLAEIGDSRAIVSLMYIYENDLSLRLDAWDAVDKIRARIRA